MSDAAMDSRARPLKCRPYEAPLRDARTSNRAQICHSKSIALLKRNLAPARYPGRYPSARADNAATPQYSGETLAVCAIGMAVSGDKSLERAAAAGLHTLAEHQARTGRCEVRDLQRQEADFWYLGCIDSTLWWLIALALLDRRRSPGGLPAAICERVSLAIQWLLAQEHQRFFLLRAKRSQRWADIMPRSGFVSIRTHYGTS